MGEAARLPGRARAQAEKVITNHRERCRADLAVRLRQKVAELQDNMRRMQEQLATLEVEGQSGAGLVKVQMTCKYEVKRVSIDPSLVGDDREMLEDLVAAAFNDASHRVESTVAEKMSGMTAGLGLPAGFKLPF